MVDIATYKANGDAWVMRLSTAEMLSLRYILDDWGDATSDADDDPMILTTKEEYDAWAAAQRLCNTVLAATTILGDSGQGVVRN